MGGRGRYHRRSSILISYRSSSRVSHGSLPVQPARRPQVDRSVGLAGCKTKGRNRPTGFSLEGFQEPLMATAAAHIRHPFAPLTPAEIEAAVAIIRAGQTGSGHLRFVMARLQE